MSLLFANDSSKTPQQMPQAFGQGSTTIAPGESTAPQVVTPAQSPAQAQPFSLMDWLGKQKPAQDEPDQGSN